MQESRAIASWTSRSVLTYDTGGGDYPENNDVALRVMDLKTGRIEPVARLFGGQGTIAVSS